MLNLDLKNCLILSFGSTEHSLSICLQQSLWVEQLVLEIVGALD